MRRPAVKDAEDRAYKVWLYLGRCGPRLSFEVARCFAITNMEARAALTVLRKRGLATVSESGVWTAKDWTRP